MDPLKIPVQQGQSGFRVDSQELGYMILYRVKVHSCPGEHTLWCVGATGIPFMFILFIDCTVCE